MQTAWRSRCPLTICLSSDVHVSLSPVDTHMPLRLNIIVLVAILAGLRLAACLELHLAAWHRYL